MEISEFARLLLLSEDLDAKLFVPDDLTDNSPGAPEEGPEEPARPAALGFHRAGTKKHKFPNAGQLIHPTQRGLALHAFANHELLALECMALALVRFPDAPTEFRRSLARTILEEQTHFRLYVARMEALGVELGDVGVNNFLWRLVFPSRTPLSFVAAVSLTFEQANLDFSEYYRRKFEEFEDERTAEIMKRVFRDEVRHVRLGATWFSKWRSVDADLDDFGAYTAALPKGLSPRRARGPIFLADARRAAGLSESFIQAIEIFADSRGRPPRVFWFNASCEEEAALRSPQTPVLSSAARDVQHDLAIVPAFLGHEADVVVTPERPRPEYLAALRRAGCELPAFCERFEDVKAAEIEQLAPWGLSTSARRIATQFGARVVQPLPEFDPARVFSKCFAAELLQRYLEAFSSREDKDPNESLFGGPEIVGQTCRTFEGAEQAIRRFLETFEAVLLKAPFSSSGRHRLRLDRAGIEHGEGREARKSAPPTASAPSTASASFIARILGEQGAILVEPYLDRVIDLSMLFKVERSGEFRWEGLTRFFTTPRGAYLGHWLGRPFVGVPSEIQRALGSKSIPSRLEHLARFVATELFAHGFWGACGIDVLVYRPPQPQSGSAHPPQVPPFRIKPIVEINPRFTMGHVALRLADHVRPGTPAEWLHLSVTSLRKRGFEGPAALLEALKDHTRIPFPPSSAMKRMKRIDRGVLPTNDPSTARRIQTLLVVSRPSIEAVRDLAGL